MSNARIISKHASISVDSSGNVGIGTTSPLVKSHIAGDTLSTGVRFFKQNTPIAKTAAATLTPAELLNGVITYNGTTATFTLPTGADMDAAILGGNLPIDTAFEFSIVAFSTSNTVTLVASTGMTILAGVNTTALATSTFRVRKTAANTFTVYKV